MNETLLLVIEYSILITTRSNMSPIIGTLNSGAAR